MCYFLIFSCFYIISIFASDLYLFFFHYYIIPVHVFTKQFAIKIIYPLVRCTKKKKEKNIPLLQFIRLPRVHIIPFIFSCKYLQMSRQKSLLIWRLLDECNKLSALFVISTFVETSLGVDTRIIFVQRNYSKETGVFLP